MNIKNINTKQPTKNKHIENNTKIIQTLIQLRQQNNNNNNDFIINW